MLKQIVILLALVMVLVVVTVVKAGVEDVNPDTFYTIQEGRNECNGGNAQWWLPPGGIVINKSTEDAGRVVYRCKLWFESLYTYYTANMRWSYDVEVYPGQYLSKYYWFAPAINGKYIARNNCMITSGYVKYVTVPYDGYTHTREAVDIPRHPYCDKEVQAVILGGGEEGAGRGGQYP